MSVSEEKIQAAWKWVTDVCLYSFGAHPSGLPLLLHQYYRLLDAGDFPTLTTKYLKEDVAFTFANLPTMKGREVVAQILGAPPASPVATLKHSYVAIA